MAGFNQHHRQSGVFIYIVYGTADKLCTQAICSYIAITIENGKQDL
jgi:hypothetical protein